MDIRNVKIKEGEWVRFYDKCISAGFRVPAAISLLMLAVVYGKIDLKQLNFEDTDYGNKDIH